MEISNSLLFKTDFIERSRNFIDRLKVNDFEYSDQYFHYILDNKEIMKTYPYIKVINALIIDLEVNANTFYNSGKYDLHTYATNKRNILINNFQDI